MSIPEVSVNAFVLPKIFRRSKISLSISCCVIKTSRQRWGCTKRRDKTLGFYRLLAKIMTGRTPGSSRGCSPGSIRPMCNPVADRHRQQTRPTCWPCGRAVPASPWK